MNSIESFFLNLGFSWTISKIIPYSCCIILGVIFVFLLKKWKTKKKYISFSVKAIIFLLPFSIYFAFSPIYQGDFSNKGAASTSKIVFPKAKALTVVALPNCPYCYQSLRLMMKLKKRNPHIPITYWVASSDTLPEKTAILRVIPKEFSALQKHNTEEISFLAKGTFPCFVISSDSKAVKVWNNNQFGVRALDEIEAFFK